MCSLLVELEFVRASYTSGSHPAWSADRIDVTFETVDDEKCTIELSNDEEVENVVGCFTEQTNPKCAKMTRVRNPAAESSREYLRKKLGLFIRNICCSMNYWA